MGDLSDIVSDSMLNDGGADVNSAPASTSATTSTPPTANSTIQGSSKVGGALGKMGAALGARANVAPNVPPLQMPNNTYGALFANQTNTPINATGNMGVQPMQMPAPIPMAQMSTPPQVQTPAMAMSDVRAKFKIEKAKSEIDAFLQTIYDNILSKKGKI